MSNENENSNLSLIEQDIASLHDKLYEFEKRGLRGSLFKRRFAYILKSIAGLSALIIAIEVFPCEYNQFFAIGSLLAVLIDSIGSLHKKLVGEVEAGYAAQRQRERISRSFNRKLAPLLDVLKSSPNGSESAIAAECERQTLLLATHEDLERVVEAIRDKFARLDLEGLRALALEGDEKTN